MGCCHNENRKNKIFYQYNPKQNLLARNSNEEIENFETKINKNKIRLNNTEEKKKENDEEKKNKIMKKKKSKLMRKKKNKIMKKKKSKLMKKKKNKIMKKKKKKKIVKKNYLTKIHFLIQMN
jgi:hypothetical protein